MIIIRPCPRRRRRWRPSGILVLLITATLALIGNGTASAQSAPGPETQHAHEGESHLREHARAIDAKAHRVAKHIAQDIERVEPYLERYGYWAVFAAVGIEGVGIPAPGQTLLEAGAMVAEVPDGKLEIWRLLVVAILATSLGHTLGYLIGRTGGRAVLDRMPIPARHLKRIDDAFNRYGGWLVLFGRFVDGPRQLIGLFSGALDMHWGRFLLLNICGAILWASFWALGVYYLGLHFDSIVNALRHLNPWVAGLTALGLLALLVLGLIALLRRRGNSSGKDGQSERA